MPVFLKRINKLQVLKFILLPILFVFFIFPPSTANAHAYSASYTKIILDQNKTEVVFSIDTLSILELINGIDTNKNWVLEYSEVKKKRHQLEEMILEGLALDKGNKEQTPDLEKLKLVKKQNKIFLSFYIKYPSFAPGDTISLSDGFYANDTGTNYVNLISASYHGETSDSALQGNDRTWTMLLTEVQQEQQSTDDQVVQQSHVKTNPEAEKSTSSWLSFFKLGIFHILTGYDHLLFLLALLFRKQTFKQYASIVTSFTIAHSITLSLAVFGLVTLPSRFVEVMIAFSICYVAIENIFRKEIRHRWGITFFFGLIHGLGFASLLQNMDIPKSKLATALLNFNLGIETIQLSIVLLLLPAIAYLHRQQFAGKFVMGGSIITAILGGFWLIERMIR